MEKQKQTRNRKTTKKRVNLTLDIVELEKFNETEDNDKLSRIINELLKQYNQGKLQV